MMQNKINENCKTQYEAEHFVIPMGEGLVFEGRDKFISTRNVIKDMFMSHLIP